MSDAAQAAIRRATTAAQIAMNALDAAALEALKQIYQQAAEDIAARIAQYAGADGNVSLSELKSVLAQIEARLSELSALRDALLNTNLNRAAVLGTQPFEGASLNTAASMRINHEALQFVRSFIAADGLQLSDRIWRLDRHARDEVTRAIEMAVVQGQGAAQAAREFMVRGEPVPIEVKSKIDAANAAKIARETTDSLMTGAGSPMDNAMRLFRTEINRAHGEAYIKGALDHPDAAGLRFLLSPGHPKPDICDLHASANLYGLGKGVYPDRKSCPWPAHPNTLSFVEVVFKDEVTDADRAGKETPMQALERLTPAQQIGVLGVNKHAAFKDGKLTQGMIKSRWSAVQTRIGQSANGGARLLPQMVTPYEIAKSGGKHHGWYLRQIELDDAALSKAVRSFERQIEKHEKWIGDPLTKTPDFSSFDPRRQASLIDGWKQDATRHRECIEILRRILKERAK